MSEFHGGVQAESLRAVVVGREHDHEVAVILRPLLLAIPEVGDEQLSE
jgi:hypothetical protein